MLHALKNALESYMSPTEVKEAVGSVPARLHDEHTTHLKRIVQDAGLLASDPFFPRPSYDLVAESIFNSSFLEGCGWDPLCDPTEIVLVINFSEAVLSLDLFFHRRWSKPTCAELDITSTWLWVQHIISKSGVSMASNG